MGRDRRGHRHGRRDAGLLAGHGRPPGAVRRKGALDTARGAGNDSLFDAGSGRAAGVPFRRNLLRGPGPGRTLHRRDRRHQRAPPDSGSCRSSAAGPADRRPSTAWSASDSSSDDFTPRQNFRDPGESTVPEAWPITYDQMAPWYAAGREAAAGFGASPIPCDRKRPRSVCPPPPPFSADNQPLVDYLAGRGLHPYHLPMACDYTDDCPTCQTYLCDRSCKNDAARNGVLPAVTEHGAQLLAECRVVRLDADRTQVRQVICEHRSGTLALKAKVVVLAAGALVTPVLLLNSRSGDWPRGLANGSDMVGRNLMRHLLDCDRDLAATRQQDHGREQGDRAQRLLFLGRAEIRHGAVESARCRPWSALTNQPGLAAKGAAPDEPGGAPGLRTVLQRRTGAGRDHRRPALSGQPRAAI